MFAASKTANGIPPGINYIEDVFSTWLYTGNGSTQSITNGIDLSGKGGLVWFKNRSVIKDHRLLDTVRGVQKPIYSNLTNAQATETTGLTAFGTTGFTVGSDNGYNGSSNNYASWTFRKQPKFFDVVTWTGDGTAGRAISHNLGSVPGAVFIKCTSNARNWRVWHRSLTTAQSMVLNSTAIVSSTDILNSTAPTSTTLTISADPDVNNSGYTYVAYLFAHNAGGFGLTGTDNVISCGSFTTDSAGAASVTLGYEPQWVLMKPTSTTGNWFMYDTMRGLTVGGNDDMVLYSNLSDAEAANGWGTGGPNATGFNITGFGATITYIYIAIRRGPMKVPTTGTSVFSPIATTASGNTKTTTNFPIDFQIQAYRTATTPNNSKVMTRLTGVNTSPVNTSLPYLITSSTAAEASADYTRYWDNTGFEISSGLGGGNSVYWNFQRAPSFFDEVCYTGTGSATTQTHNLAAVPEFMIVKQRGGAGNWTCYSATYGGTYFVPLNTTAAASTSTGPWNNTNPTASVFTVGTSSLTNNLNSTYVAYLFATCPGVSKVGSYTGNGTTQTINCGFTGGARFVLIKRTDTTGSWFVWDTARGMTTVTDPYLLLNNTAAETATLGACTTVSTGFSVNDAILTGINTTGGTYIFLAIA